MADASLDLVVAFDVLEHIEDDDAAVREVLRALRPGGHYLVAVPCDPKLWSAHDEAVGHVRRYTRPTLTALLVRNGFAIGPVRPGTCCCGPVVAAAAAHQQRQRPGRAARAGQPRAARGDHRRALPAGALAARRLAAGRGPTSLSGLASPRAAES